jgi:hypothetical protein
VADTAIKEWTTDPMRNVAQASKDKKMGFLKDLLVRVFHSIS